MRRLFFVFFALFFISRSIANQKLPNKHVLLIGIDGCRQDAFKKAVDYIRKHQSKKFPYFLSLVDKGAIDYHIYAGGHVYDKTKQVTTSSPGWTTILTGVWANQHNIKKNNDILWAKMEKSIPTVFNYIKTVYPNAYTASISDWFPLGVLSSLIHQGEPPDYLLIEYFLNLTDVVTMDLRMKDHAVQEIISHQPMFTFVYFGQVDEFGHASGFNPNNTEYMDAIYRVVEHIDWLVYTVESERSKGQKWLIAVVPDHGGHELTHGSQMWTDREIFAIFQDPSDPRYCCKQEIKAVQGQTTIVPTVLDYLVGNYSLSTFPKVYGLPIGSAAQNLLYIRLNDTEELEVLPGFPQPTGEHFWRELNQYGNKIETIIEGLGTKILFLLNNGQYLQYDYPHQKIDPGYPKDIDLGFPGLSLWLINITAAVRNRTSVLFFLNDGKFLNFNL